MAWCPLNPTIRNGLARRGPQPLGRDQGEVRRRSWQLQGRSQSLFKMLLLCSLWISNFALEMLVLKVLHPWVFWPPLKLGSPYISSSLPHPGPSSAPALGLRVPAEPGLPWDTAFPPSTSALMGQAGLPRNHGSCLHRWREGLRPASSWPPGDSWSVRGQLSAGDTGRGAVLSLRGLSVWPGATMTQAFMPPAWI